MLARTIMISVSTCSLACALSNYDHLRAAKMMPCNSANNFNDNPKSALRADAHQEARVTTHVLYHFVVILCGKLWYGNCLYQQNNTLTTLAVANTIVGTFCTCVGGLAATKTVYLKIIRYSCGSTVT